MRFLLALCLLCSPLWAAPPPQSFAVRYRLTRDGLPVGETLIRLKVAPDGAYRYSALTTPNALSGLWRNDIVEEVSEGRLVNGRPRPRRYTYHRSGEAPRILEIRFDWTAGRLRVNGDGESWTASLAPGVLDKLVQQWALSLDLARRESLPAGGPLVRYQVADGGRIKTYVYEVETFDEAGLRLRRSKDGTGADYSLVLDPARGWLPVRIERNYGGHLWRMEWLGGGD